MFHIWLDISLQKSINRTKEKDQHDKCFLNTTELHNATDILSTYSPILFPFNSPKLPLPAVSPHLPLLINAVQ